VRIKCLNISVHARRLLAQLGLAFTVLSNKSGAL
jgi:hypothetical protein